jgi:preprotein translocase subunit YajC
MHTLLVLIMLGVFAWLVYFLISSFGRKQEQAINERSRRP